jgi:uncharacterized protein (TIRG00374 family)
MLEAGAGRAEPTPSRWRIVVRIVFLLLTAGALYILWPSLIAVFREWPELLRIEPYWFPAILGLEITSFVLAWGLLRLALRTKAMFRVATAQLSGNAFSRLVPGGAAAGGALQYSMLVQGGLEPARVGAAVTAASFISTGTLLALPVLAVPAVVFGAPAPSGLTQAAWLGAGMFAVVFAVSAVLLSFDRPLEATGRLLQRLQNRVRRRKGEPTRVDLPQKLLLARNQMRTTLGRDWWKALLFSVGNWAFDYGALLAALWAVGARPRPSLVLLAYVGAAVLGMIPITPGGLGFVEAGLAATLALAGVPAAEAALAVLAYRLVSYWLPLPAGGIAYVAYRRRYGRIDRVNEPGEGSEVVATEPRPNA